MSAPIFSAVSWESKPLPPIRTNGGLPTSFRASVRYSALFNPPVENTERATRSTSPCSITCFRSQRGILLPRKMILQPAYLKIWETNLRLKVCSSSPGVMKRATCRLSLLEGSTSHYVIFDNPFLKYIFNYYFLCDFMGKKKSPPGSLAVY